MRRITSVFGFNTLQEWPDGEAYGAAYRAWLDEHVVSLDLDGFVDPEIATARGRASGIVGSVSIRQLVTPDDPGRPWLHRYWHVDEDAPVEDGGWTKEDWDEFVAMQAKGLLEQFTGLVEAIKEGASEGAPISVRFLVHRAGDNVPLPDYPRDHPRMLVILDRQDCANGASARGPKGFHQSVLSFAATDAPRLYLSPTWPTEHACTFVGEGLQWGNVALILTDTTHLPAWEAILPVAVVMGPPADAALSSAVH